MKDLHYTTIASDSHSIMVSTWKQTDAVRIGNVPGKRKPVVDREQWHYKFVVNGNTVDEGILGPVDETVHADHE